MMLVFDEDGVMRKIELNDLGEAVLTKAARAVARGRWPLICWAEKDDPWVMTRDTA